MNTATIKFDAFEGLKNDDCQERIIKAKKTLGEKIVRFSGRKSLISLNFSGLLVPTTILIFFFRFI